MNDINKDGSNYSRTENIISEDQFLSHGYYSVSAREEPVHQYDPNNYWKYILYFY